MAKSFFERLTGSVRINNDDSSSGGDSEEYKKVPTKKPRIRPAQFSEEQSETETENVYAETAQESGEDYFPVVAKVAERKTSRPVLPKREELIPRFDGGQNAIMPEDEDEGQLTLDIYDADTHFVVQSTVAGVKPEDIDVVVTDDTLTIKGSRMRQSEVGDDRYYAKELYWGRFSRSVILPEPVDGDKVDASLKDGILTIKIPKKSYSAAKKVKVRGE